MKTKLMALVALAGITAACSKTEMNVEPSMPECAASFSATISNAPSTRASDTQWDSNDKIGVSGLCGSHQYTNVSYISEGGDGNFVPELPDTDIYYQDQSASVQFTAYYPHSASLAEAEFIAADTKNQSQQKTFDFLWSQASGSKQTPSVAFTFSHKMAKVCITLKKGKGVSFEELQKASLSLYGLKDLGKFNVTSGETVLGENVLAKGDWTFANGDPVAAAPSSEVAGESVTYTLILFPQTFTKDQLHFVATTTVEGTQEFEVPINLTSANNDGTNVLAAGIQYNIPIRLNKTEVKVEGAQITGWDAKELDPFDAQ